MIVRNSVPKDGSTASQEAENHYAFWGITGRFCGDRIKHDLRTSWHEVRRSFCLFSMLSFTNVRMLLSVLHTAFSVLCVRSVFVYGLSLFESFFSVCVSASVGVQVPYAFAFLSRKTWRTLIHAVRA